TLEESAESFEQSFASSIEYDSAAPDLLVTEAVAESTPLPHWPNADVDGDKLVDFRQIGDAAGFAGRALGRHKLIGAVVFVLVITATGGVIRLWPRTYH